MALKVVSKRQAVKKGLVNPGGKAMSKRQLAKRGYAVKDFSKPTAPAKPVAPKPVGPPPVAPGIAKREDYADPLDFSDTFEYRDPGGNLGSKTGL